MFEWGFLLTYSEPSWVSQMSPIKSSQLASKLSAELSGDSESVIVSVSHDSRKCGAGSLFAAIRGATMDGHRFIPDVMRAGAVGVMSELDRPENFTGVWLKVKEIRRALAVAASFVFNEPSRGLDLVGITGTNGKTTTSYLCFDALRACGRIGAMLTTVEYRVGDVSEEATRTTPEASDTNEFLRRSVELGCTFAVMESSSQALHLHRCDQLFYKVAVFTNLTRDHLDYHGTMDDYFDAKKMLFDGRLGEPPTVAVINIDDEYGARLVEKLSGTSTRTITYALNSDADLRATDIDISLIGGTSFSLSVGGVNHRVNSPLVGIPHVYNTLAALGTVLALGCDMTDAVRGISSCKGAPGRFERVENSKGLAVVVDYAHTDDALQNTISTARRLTDGRVITVFGCGGDRDAGKRAPMGEVAGRLSDYVIATSDNPRSEEPLKILEDIERGLIASDANYELIPDRKSAIAKAISSAKLGDVVLICGKGHETYQILGSETVHFDDREVAKEILESRL